MKSKSFGFRAGEEKSELTELEQKLKLVLVDSDNEPFEVYVGKPVRVFAGSGTAYGIYRGLNEKGYLVLFPSVMPEYYPISPDSDASKMVYYWEKDMPHFIKRDSCVVIGSVKKRYLDWIVQNWGRRIPEISESKS